MSGWHGGKGSDQRPEAVPGSYMRNYPNIDMNARARKARGCKGQFVHLLADPPKPAVIGCTCGHCDDELNPDLVPSGYFDALAKRIAACPQLPETENDPEPLL